MLNAFCLEICENDDRVSLKKERPDMFSYVIRIAVLAVIAVALSFSAMLIRAQEAQAADVFAKVEVAGKENIDFSNSIDKLNDYISDNSGSTITIHMQKNWNAAEDGIFDKALVIPKKTKVTLYMHGYVFNRNNAWDDISSASGEVIRVEADASLTVDGGTEEEQNSNVHENVAVYNPTASGTKATGRITVKGGCITGGVCTKGGGGIYAKSGTAITVKNTTIAGCCSRQGFLFDNGYGGGVWLYGDNATLRMSDSRITGCRSDDKGGGICVEDEDKITIELSNTSIDNNYSLQQGGGIYIGGEKCHITGFKGAAIKNNQAGHDGGGIFFQDINESATGLRISENSACNGGGVYSGSDRVSMSDLHLNKNNASDNGGGIYISEDNNTISGCEVKENSAKKGGGGVYVYKNVNTGFNVKGETTVVSNDCTLGRNFYISDSAPEDTRVNFSLSKGAEVGVYYTNTDNKDYIMVTEGKVGDTKKSPNCIRYLKSENSDYHFTFNSSPDQRKIYYVKNGKDSQTSGDPEPEPVKKTFVRAADAVNMPGQAAGEDDKKAGIIGTVGPGGFENTSGNKYDLIFGFALNPSYTSSVDLTSPFYYSDGFFDDDRDPAEYNSHLATTSLVMANSGMYLRAKASKDEKGNIYYNRHAAGRQFMADIGCPDQNIYVNDYNVIKPQMDSIGVTIASKELKMKDGESTGKILVPVVVRGGGYEKEWASNTTLGHPSDVSGKEAQGFHEAAEMVTEEIEKYIGKYELKDALRQGKVKFWVAGYSRAGATANLTSKRLIEKYASGSGDFGNNQVYGYCLEPPMGGTDDAEKLSDKTKYYSIHNLVNATDLVPHVAPHMMGFKRYGVDHYIPGTPACDPEEIHGVQTPITRGGEGGVTTKTTYVDNKQQYIKNVDPPAEHVSPETRADLFRQIRAVDSDVIIDDYFHPMSMDYAPNIKFYEEGNYEHNHIEEFLKDFFRYAQEGLNENTQTVPNRDYYADNLQKALRETLSLIFSMDPDDSSGFFGRAARVMDKFSTTEKLNLYVDVISNWDERSDSEKRHYYTMFWKKLEETGAFEFLAESDVAKLEQNWPQLANFVFALMNADHQYRPGPISAWAGSAENESMLIATFVTFSGYITQNHSHQVILAWERAFDSYYSNNRDRNEYSIISDGYIVRKPSAKGKETVAAQEGGQQTGDKDVLLKEGTDETNRLTGDQKIVLDVDSIVGEAVYYDLWDRETEEKIAGNEIYRGGVDLIIGDNSKRKYRLRTYAISYGKRSEKAVYNINLYSDRHDVKVKRDSVRDDNYLFKDGADVAIDRKIPVTRYFKEWKLLLKTEDGDTLADISSILGDSKTAFTAKFTMPSVGETYTGKDGETGEYPDAYSLQLEEICGDRITKITLPEDSSLVPEAGENTKLTEKTTLTFTSGEGTPREKDWIPKDDDDQNIEYDISWSYKDTKDGKEGLIPADTDKVYDDAEYTATIVIPEIAAKEILFMDSPVLWVPESIRSNVNSNETYCVRDSRKGNVTIVIAFNKTGNSGHHPKPSVPVLFTVEAHDMNLPEDRQHISGADKSYYMKQNDVLTMTAPQYNESIESTKGLKDESFQKWNLEGSGLELVEGYSVSDKTIKVRAADSFGEEGKIKAEYYPVVNKIEAVLDEPVSGEKMQMTAKNKPDENPGEDDNDTLMFKVTNRFVIHKDNVEIEWSPTPAGEGSDTADYLTTYKASIRIKKAGSSDTIKVRMLDDDGKPTGEYMDVYARFVVGDNVEATINGKQAVVNKDNSSISYTFPATTYDLKSVELPDDIKDIDHGTDEDGLKEILPKTVKAVIGDDVEIGLPVQWKLTPEKNDGQGGQDESKDPREEVTWIARAKIDLPDGLDDRYELIGEDGILKEGKVRLTVREADYAASPDATLTSGTYLANQTAFLETKEKGGRTYYTLDGTDPTTSETRKEYEGEEIYISREDDEHLVPEMAPDEHGVLQPTGRKKFILKAFTVRNEGDDKDKKWDSAVVTYEYVFDNEIPVPKGKNNIYDGSEQVGVEGSKFYTIEKTDGGGRVDEDGDAVGKNAGTYKVTLKLVEGQNYVWKLSDEEVSSDADKMPAEAKTTTEDQEVGFTIEPASLKEAKIEILTAPQTADGKPKTPQIKVTLHGISLDPGDYDITYSDNINAGKGKVRVRGKGNYKDESREFEFEILGKKDDSKTDENKDDSKKDKKKTKKEKKKYNKLLAMMKYKGKRTLVITWTKAEKADGYDLYFAKCTYKGKKYKFRKVAGVKRSAKRIFRMKGLKERKPYKAYVRAYIKKNGKKKYVSKSLVIHAFTGGISKKNYCDPRKVTVKKTKATLKKGKTLRIRAHVIKLRKNRMLITEGHTARLRYLSSNSKVAKVSNNGRITAKGKGRCRIYVIAANGVYKAVKLTVKQ